MVRGMMEQKTETIIVYRGYIAVYRGYIGLMENEMETTI